MLLLGADRQLSGDYKDFTVYMTTADSFDRAVCGCSLTGIAVSNPAGGMDVSRATGR